MTTLDWIIVIVLGLGAVQGFMKGFVSQVISIVDRKSTRLKTIPKQEKGMPNND